MRRNALLLSSVFVFIVFSCSILSAQTTINVPADQPTIQAGIDAASDGDTVLVSDGQYHEHINFKGKNITVASVNGAESTIIDGDQDVGPVVRIVSNEIRSAVLAGFRIQNGTAFGSEGGGIQVANASPSILANVITQNTGLAQGGGINVNGGGPLIDSNIISQNTVSLTDGTSGAGISVNGTPHPPLAEITNNVITQNSGVASGAGIGLVAAGPVLIQNNLITDNIAAGQGGGIDITDNGGAIVAQNVVTGNAAASGSAIHIFEPSDSAGNVLVNNTIANNDALTDAAVVTDGFNANALIENNIVVTTSLEQGLLCNPTAGDQPPSVAFNDVFSSQGAGAAYAGNCSGSSGSNRNISDDPQFANSSDNDLHLLVGSPAIDAGDNSAPKLPAADFDGNQRLIDGTGTGTPIVDMGAYEFQIAP
jgi:parallel beta-helix repeat protein